jgi:hypothetical protein
MQRNNACITKYLISFTLCKRDAEVNRLDSRYSCDDATAMVSAQHRVKMSTSRLHERRENYSRTEARLLREARRDSCFSLERCAHKRSYAAASDLERAMDAIFAACLRRLR